MSRLFSVPLSVLAAAGIISGSSVVESAADPLPSAALSVIQPPSKLVEGKPARQPHARGAAPQAAIDVQHYSIDVAFDFPTTSVLGAVRVDALTLAGGTSNVGLDMGANLTVDDVQSDGGSLSYTHTGDRLDIQLGEALGAGDTFSFVVSYHGTGNVFDDYGLMFSEHETGPNIWTFVEPDGARLWFPCVDEPIDKATFDLTATIDAALTASSNGPVGDIVDNGSTKTWHFEHPYPISTYLIVFNASNFEVIEDSWTPPGATDPMPITHYVYPQLLDAATEDFSITPFAFDLCTEWFGPYPFADVGYSHTLFPWPGAMEHQTNSSYGAGLITGGHDYDNILVHEIAHQWFGDRVGPADWKEIWLNESFATYAEALFFDAVFSEEFGFDVLPFVMDAFHNVYFDFHDGPDHPVYGPPEGHLFCLAEYYKGAAVLHMLRDEIGDDAFFTTLRTHTAEDAPLSARTKSFQLTAEAVSGRDLGWFFSQWIFGSGYPTLEVAWQDGSDTWGVPTGERGADAVTVDFRQTQEWAPFRIPIDIRVYAGDAVIDDTFVMDSRRARHVISLPAGADSLEVDPDFTLFAKIVDTRRAVSVPAADAAHDMLVSPNPFRGAVAIRVPLTEDKSIVLRIFDANGRHVRSLGDVTSETVQWDGRDHTGHAVRPGMYFLEAEGATGTRVEKLLKVR